METGGNPAVHEEFMLAGTPPGDDVMKGNASPGVSVNGCFDGRESS